MALLDKGLLQRMVGALVLIAIAVIFVPMLFNRQDDLRHVTVDAPSIPAAPVVADIEMQPVEVPEAKSAPEGFEIIEEGATRLPPRLKTRCQLRSSRLLRLILLHLLRQRSRRSRSRGWTTITCRSAGRFSWQAYPIARVRKICSRRCVRKATTPISAPLTG